MKWSAAAAGAAALPGAIGCSSAAGGVVVVGGGLGGLCAAYELMMRGVSVKLLEAQDHVGGRVLTVRDGLASGLWAEAGAVRIPDVHMYTLQYVTKFNLMPLSFPPDFPLNVMKADRFTHKEGDPWPADFMLTMNEAQKGLRAVQDYAGVATDTVGDPRAMGWPPSSVAMYDGMSVTDFFRAQGASDDFIALVVADGGTELLTANALDWLAGNYLDRLWQATFTISGGNDQLPKAFAKALGDRVLLSSPVMKIEQDGSSVTVHYTSGSSTKTITAAACVVAVPVPLLAQIEVPSLPDDKRMAIAQHTMMSADRVYLQTKSRFWNTQEKLTGLKVVRTDKPIERIWDPSSVMPGDKGLLLAYLQGANADALCAMPSSQRGAWALQQATQVFPELTTGYDGVAVEKCWKEDPWAKGAWSAPTPGQAWIRPVLARAEGRLHFAGEHTSVWPGWMNGALESGQRAAMEIMGVVGAPAMARRAPSRRLVRFG